ncbi:hypothetical protein F5Y15DRAFT_428188 [Xylariaceae sp. FL0016]|nr:hypothetical protein F5Y15DRAFT_428188 [Xylariaceae sp. FL0016]
MKLSAFFSALSWVTICHAAAADGIVTESSMRVRNPPGYAYPDTIIAIKRALSDPTVTPRNIDIVNSTSLDKSWNGAVLYKQGVSQSIDGGNYGSVSTTADVEITCVTCYTKGMMSGRVTITGDLDLTETKDSLETQFEEDAKNITDQILNITATEIEDIFTGGAPPPTFDFDFNIDIEGIPEISLDFTFDDLELYMQIDTSLSVGSTYTLNLFQSESPIDFAVSDVFQLGVVLGIDLILDAKAEIDISSGFHLKIDDGLAINIALFSAGVSDIVFPGGKFEFLPVTITTAEASLKAVLRVGVHAGIQFQTDSDEDEAWSLGAGLEGSVFANVAEFVTNVTSGTGECELEVVEYYELAVGAAAGATAHWSTHSWGPTPNTTTAIFYTTLADVCASQGTRTSTATLTTTTDDSIFEKRDDWSTTETTITYTGQACQSTGLINCPVSLQTTTTFEATLTTSVPSGNTPTFPQSVMTTVASTIPFGTNVKDLKATSGTPTSFVPNPTHHANNFLNGETGGVSNKIIIGVGIGLGVPVLLAAIILCWYVDLTLRL